MIAGLVSGKASGTTTNKDAKIHSHKFDPPPQQQASKQANKQIKTKAKHGKTRQERTKQNKTKQDKTKPPNKPPPPPPPPP